uniref:C-type lectin domain-containing protein n=1 Tax=Pinctada fucata TaxID=50426 RepID=A0A194AK64_PINFU
MFPRHLCTFTCKVNYMVLLLYKTFINLNYFKMLAAVLVALLYTAYVSGDCQSGWTRYEQSCYLISHFPATWTEAQYFCSTLRANLVEIYDRGENSFLENTLISLYHNYGNDNNNFYGYWMGLRDVQVENEFKWVSSGTSAVFNDWKTGQPDNVHSGIEDEDCVAFDSAAGFKWNDANCALKKYFICEKPSQRSK